jgi:integrase
MPCLADFSVYLHSVKKCKVATIIGHRSAISSKHKGWGGRSVSTNGDLSKLIKGIFNSNPILKPLLPNWDLPSVLWRLCDPPFEPLLSCDVKFLTWKTVFLIALATASRVSELHALSVKDGNLRYERHGIRLLPNLQFTFMF